MELISKLRWVIVVVALLLLLVLTGWGLAAIARSLFADKSATGTSSEISSLELQNADVIRYTQEGPIVASSEHRSYTIEVTRNVVVMRLYSDYGKKIINEKSYLNSETAFENLLKGLESENVLARVPRTTEDDDNAEVGVCPEGRRYVVEVGNEVRRWITDCPEAKKTAGGNMPAIRRLFSKQIPEFRDIIKGTTLK